MEVIISLTPTLIIILTVVLAYLLSVVLEIRKELRKLNDSISSKLEKIALNKERNNGNI
jgi:predicted Holliday junction resolvase-like endonuclease